MKILGIVGSLRKNGNTDILVDNVLNGVKDQGVKLTRFIFQITNFQIV